MLFVSFRPFGRRRPRAGCVGSVLEVGRNAAEHCTIDAAGDGLHGRQQVHVDQFLERLARFAIVDDERVVEPLVQRHLHVGGVGVLLDEPPTPSALRDTLKLPGRRVLTTSPKFLISSSKSRWTRLAATMFSSTMTRPS